MDLNRKERDYLLSEAAPATVRDYTIEVGEADLGLRIRALEKITAMAHAERDTILAIRMLELLRDAELSAADVRQIRRLWATAAKEIAGAN